MTRALQALIAEGHEIGQEALACLSPCQTVLSPLNVGTHSLTAVYSGDAHYTTAVSSPQQVTVAPEPVRIAIDCGGTSEYGKPVTCKATVAGVTPAQGTLAWSIDGTPQNSTLNASGSAAITLHRPEAGKHTVVATFAAQGNFAAATGTATFTIAPANTTTVLVAGSAKVAAGTPLTLKATVNSSTGGAPTTGTVTFYDGKAAIGTAPVNASGTASLTTTSLAKGTHALTATYGATPDFAASTSKAVSVVVN